MCIFLSKEFCVAFEKAGGYDTLGLFIVGENCDELREKSTVKIRELEQMEKQMLERAPGGMAKNSQTVQYNSKSAFNLSMVLLDAATEKFDNVYAMSPEKQTLV